MKSLLSKGIIGLVIASFFYGIQGIFIRFIGTDFGVFYPFAIRGFIIAGILFILLYLNKTYKKIESRDYKWFLLMPISGVVSFIIIFIAYNNIAIGTVLFVYYAGLVISGFISGYLLFKEKLNKVKVLSLALSLAGLFLVFSTSILQKELFYLIITFISGVASSFWFIFSKKISSYPFSQILAVDSLVAFIISLSLSVLLKEHLSFPSLSIQWISVFGLTAVSLGAFLLSIYGFRFLQAQIASLVLLLEVIFGIFLAWIFFTEVPTAQVLLGGTLILVGSALPNLSFEKRS